MEIYKPLNIKDLDITNLSMQELENLLYHFASDDYLESYDINGMKPVIGENSHGIDKEESIFFSKGLEACLELWDVWLKWRLNRLNNPMHKGKTQEERDANIERFQRGDITDEERKQWYYWINSFRNMEFLNRKELLQNLFDYQLEEMKKSDYLTLDLIRGEEYVDDQIDQKKLEAINKGKYDLMQVVMYGKYSNLNSKIADKWNLQTIPGKKIVIPPERLKRLKANNKFDVYSIVEFMYDKYKKEIPIEKQVKFDLLDLFMQYSKNKNHNLEDVLQLKIH